MQEIEIPNILLYAVPFFVISLVAEWMAVKTGHAQGRYEVKDAVTSMTMGTGNLVANMLTSGLAGVAFATAYEVRLFTLPTNALIFVVALILMDFIYYWKHRAMHRIRWFWMEHVTHHSSTHYNLSTALRQPWFGYLTGLFVFGVPMAIIGFHPAFLFLSMSVNLLYQFWIHTEAIDRMPKWFEAVMNTPSHHRVHHATNPKYLDANYAGVFIVWDKMFGSFVEEDRQEPCAYGIVKPVNSYNPLRVAYHELVDLVKDFRKDGPRPLQWFGRLVNAPGWSPDGNHNRTEEIKERAGIVSRK